MEMQDVYASEEHDQARKLSSLDFARGTRLLDIGCGEGNSLLRHGTEDYELVVGVDIRFESILKAKMIFPDCHFVVARAKSLPFADGSFDRAISDVAVPYTDIPEALKDVSRVLASGGAATLQLHSLRFAASDLWRRAKVLSVNSLAGGVWTVINGFAFQFTGRCYKMPASRSGWDSWQSMSAMKAALRKAGFAGRIEAPFVINASKREEARIKKAARSIPKE